MSDGALPSRSSRGTATVFPLSFFLRTWPGGRAGQELPGLGPLQLVREGDRAVALVVGEVDAAGVAHALPRHGRPTHAAVEAAQRLQLPLQCSHPLSSKACQKAIHLRMVSQHHKRPVHVLPPAVAMQLPVDSSMGCGTKIASITSRQARCQHIFQVYTEGMCRRCTAICECILMLYLLCILVLLRLGFALALGPCAVPSQGARWLPPVHG